MHFMFVNIVYNLIKFNDFSMSRCITISTMIAVIIFLAALLSTLKGLKRCLLMLAGSDTTG